jgi:hypothetical protein
MAEPVSIRTNNPGAMWGGKRAERWGATDDLRLNDGQGNHIAVFPTRVQGAAAQFDLWKSLYVDMTLAAAIRKWSGGNSSPAYAAFLEKHCGVKPQDEVTHELLAGPQGLALMKAQAQWEAGAPYPMSDAEWKTAQGMVFPGVAKQPAPAPRPQPKPAAQPTPQVKPWWLVLLGLLPSILKGTKQ